MRKRLEMLRIEHRDLDVAIDALTSAGGRDQLQVARLKKRKLKLKDQISMLEDYLIPDIIGCGEPSIRPRAGHIEIEM